MSNGEITKAQIKLMLADLPKGRERDRAEYTLTTLMVLTARVTSITQHCKYCDDHDDARPAKPAEPDSEHARRTWVMWGVGRWLIDRVLAVAIAAALGCLITLALTGQLGG